MDSYSIEWEGDLPDGDETMVDLGGGMVVPLREIVDSAREFMAEEAHDATPTGEGPPMPASTRPEAGNG